MDEEQEYLRYCLVRSAGAVRSWLDKALATPDLPDDQTTENLLAATTILQSQLVLIQTYQRQEMPKVNP